MATDTAGDAKSMVFEYQRESETVSLVVPMLTIVPIPQLETWEGYSPPQSRPEVHPATFPCAPSEPPPYPHSMRPLQLTFLRPLLPRRNPRHPAQAPSTPDTCVQFSGTMIGDSGWDSITAIRSSNSIQPGLAASACIQLIRSGILTAFA